MENSPQLDAAARSNLEKAAKAIDEVRFMKQEFFQCHDFLARRSHRLVELLSEAECRGVLLEESLELIETSFWLEMIDWQSKFLSIVLSFTKDPSRKSLRPLIELYGRDRERMRVEAEILEQQLRDRVARYAKPDDAAVRKVVAKNEQRILAVYLHVRSGYRGVDLARFFKVPRTTAYGWLDWFKMLPEGLRNGILTFMDSQAPRMAACQRPGVMPKPVANSAASTGASQTAAKQSA